MCLVVMLAQIKLTSLQVKCPWRSR